MSAKVKGTLMIATGMRAFALATIAALCSTAAPASAVPYAALRGGMTWDRVPLALRPAPAARGIAARVAWSRDVRDLGALDGRTPVHVAMIMRYRHEAELQRLVRMQGEKGTPYYHRFLNNAQWNGYFAADPVAYRHTLATLGRAGFRVEREFANRGMIGAVAPARTVERFFTTKLHRVLQIGRTVAYANVTPAIMPAELRSETIGVAGLHSFAIAHYPMRRSARPYRAGGAGRSAGVVLVAATPSAKPITKNTPPPNPNPEATIPGGMKNVGPFLGMSPYGPFAYATSYDFPVQHGYNGHGRNVGNVISGDFLDSDLAGFYAQFDFKNTGSVNRVLVSGPVNFVASSPDSGESTLDVEAILGLAPGANFYEYLIPQLSDDQILFAYERAVSDNVVDAVNSSFGGCETDDPSGGYEDDYVAMQGAAKGITFNASTGDTGSQGCGVVANGAPGTYPLPTTANPSSGYYFTAVGGTSFVANPNTGDYVREAAWITGGGGISQLLAEPDWQMATPGTSTAGRNVPDLSFPADPNIGGYATYDNGAPGGSGGTSLASPLFTALQIEINEIQHTRNGWVNPRLYAINNAESYYAFHDVTAGSNIRYPATPGYDNATGIGSPIGWLLAGTE